ncbi:hypothetical protein [Pseudogemmobacter sonorensis]|uniref:hypothetical protein n=1 Tax=Pseudogemmobacter sonorensis TaxID=2989681 RepID=UPI0036D1CF0A
MARREAPPLPIVRLTQSGISPVSRFDADELALFPAGTEFDMKPRTRRSLPQHRTYWKALSRAVEATGRWPSREALHKALKINAGLVEPILDLRGRVVGMQANSTALDAMLQHEFQAYFQRAMADLSEAIGYDALAWMEEA